LLPGLADLEIQLETGVGCVALYQLFLSMDLEVYDFQVLLMLKYLILIYKYI